MTVTCEFVGGPKDGEHITIDSAALYIDVPTLPLMRPVSQLDDPTAEISAPRIERYTRCRRMKDGAEVLLHETLARG